MGPDRLGQRMIQAGLITQEQLAQALEVQRKEGGQLGSILLRLGFVEEPQLLAFLSRQYNVPALDLRQMEPDPSVVRLIPPEVARKHHVIPVRRQGKVITLAMVDPTDVFVLDDVKFLTGYDVEPVVASEASVLEAIQKYYENEPISLQEALRGIELEGEAEDLDILEEKEEEVDLRELQAAVREAPVVKLVNLILTEAIRKGASDIHIEAYEKKFRVRFRIDGILHEVMQPPKRLRAALISRIKIMSELDIAERRLPQDGRIKLKIRDREVDLRVSTIPTLFGEKVVIRILDKGTLSMDLTRLGFEPKALEEFQQAIHAPYGMILVTGPTGSGKSTTLYSALQQINDVGRNIMTAEDPVEYNIYGINQVQIREEIGLTFAAALRSFLRQDPDVIMVGEIRDTETAEIAIKAALTGHLVLSTLHTNDAASTITRLLNMGIEPFLVASSVILILAQRLARKICAECREPHCLPLSVLVEAGFSPEEARNLQLFRGKGCPNCNHTGYRGRIALYEVMPIDEELRELVLRGASATELKRAAVARGMRTLRMSGLSKVRDGITTLEEVLRTTFAD